MARGHSHFCGDIGEDRCFDQPLGAYGWNLFRERDDCLPRSHKQPADRSGNAGRGFKYQRFTWRSVLLIRYRSACARFSEFFGERNFASEFHLGREDGFRR